MSSGVAELPRTDTVDRSLLHQAAAVLDRHFDCPFFFFDGGEHAPPECPDAGTTGELPEWLTGLARDLNSAKRATVFSVSEMLQALVIPVPRGNRSPILAIGVFATRPIGEAEQDELADELGEPLRADSVRFCHPELLERLGAAVQAAVAAAQRLSAREAEIQQLAAQLSRNYEEITLLHQLTREAQVSHGVRALQELTLSLLSELLGSAQVVFVESSTGAILDRGPAILPLQKCSELIQAIAERASKGVMVENFLDRHTWASGFAEIGRLIALPVADRNEQFGWLLAFARSDDPELGSVEASLMSAVAAILATHHTNVQLYSNIKDLFLGVVRALSSAVDAKDPYTCGHSERVARLARRIAQSLGLADDDCNRVYLSGLLHDVGKIGIRDAVLLKPGRLEPDERLHIQEHPTIGYEILSGVRQLRPVIAGVRNHHENFDGTGYPDQLRGEQIPLIARILAVADSYDAMSSDRPYRKGMAEPQIDAIFREGMDKQWDRRVVEAFLTLRDEMQHKSSAHAAVKTAADSPQGNSASEPREPFDLSKVSKLITLANA